MLEKKILLIDDEETILDTYSALLAEKGYLVVTANCGKSGLEECFLQSFDLVITDLTMPGIDGFALIQEIKENFPETPVIVFTGNGAGYRSVKEYASLLGAEALIEKTCSNEMFISCIANSL